MKAEKYTPQFPSDPSVCIEMYHLTLLLRSDLNSLQHHDLQSILVEVDRSSTQVDWSTCSKEAVSSVFKIAVGHYDKALETGTTDTEDALSNMSAVVSRAAALNTPRTDLLLAVLLNRLDGLQGQLDIETARDLLEKLAPVLATLDAFSVELLEKNAYKFPPELQRTLTAMLPKDASLEKYRRCLQLVCDPNHLLTHYCEELVMALRVKDPVKWKSTLERMREKIFDNPYAGASYKLLDKHKGDLYGMYEFESTSEFASRAETKLKSIVMSIRREPQSTLRLSDLCPTLLRPLDEGVERWFGLRGVKIVKFYDKVQVFTDSIRRPVVISTLVSCGRTHRVIHKTGEQLTRDAASQRVAAALNATAYSVTLLDEESALIEFLEGHERVRSMIATTCNLNVLHGVSRPADGLLAESPAASLQVHEQLCAKVPASALRSAMEQSSSCVQDFIWKKRNFTDSLADMTLLTWLLGLGDRHLQNMMCSRAGAVRAVDFGDVWRRAELPARLTRNLLAVSDVQVLEARLQSSLSAMRGFALLLEAAIRVAFHWMEPEIEDQMRHVRGILRGEATSYDVCRDVTSRSQHKYKEKYIQLLDRTLGDSHRDIYTVEEQISCLLRHCTSPELLSVVRAGWEPWL
ncbi:DNA-dependent protein kinase catalytic subunit-like [Cydia fagiglandana]|uniref:DNA-dependent protein kinase catalytic subunit-like n=1 Tax=Cydia fagiglandana TaxID=1458189 RepID=UPI002FEE3E52